MCGDQILGVVKAKNTLKEQVLSVQPISGWYNVGFGPCLIRAGEFYGSIGQRTVRTSEHSLRHLGGSSRISLYIPSILR